MADVRIVSGGYIGTGAVPIVAGGSIQGSTSVPITGGGHISPAQGSSQETLDVIMTSVVTLKVRFTVR
jgi:hypothetical protein